MKIEIEVDRDILENVFVTAIEGGSNHWCYLGDEAIDIIRRVIPKDDDKFLSTALLSAVLDHGAVVPVNDAENEDDVLGYLNRDTFKERLESLMANEDYSWSLMNEILESGDSSSSDIVFQYLVMGEAIFG